MRKLKLFSLLAALVCATTMWAATEFAYCYDCQRSPAYPTLNQTCRLSGFRNPYVGNGALAGPWKLEFVDYYDPDNDVYHVSEPVDGTCYYYFSGWYSKTEEEKKELQRTIKVYALYQKQDDVWTLAARSSNYGYGVVVADNPSTNTALFISGQGRNGCFLTDALYSNEDSYNMDVTEDLSHSTPATPAVTGKLTGAFSVSADKQVYFSQGNLQYQASTNTWRFAEHQYDFIGDAAGNNTESGRNTQSDWIDLFGWATSGNSASGTAYQPWQSSTTDSEYGPAITSGQWTYANSDWGINPISNGGNVANSWRTLTQEEWDYILNERETGYRFCYAKLSIGDGLGYGLIILPDDWDPSYYALSAGSMNQGNHSYDSNVISEEDWTNSLEAHGAVFLPVTGMRYNGNEVIGLDDDKIGLYWSSIAAELHEVIEDSEEDPMIIDIVNAAYNLAFNGGYYIRANQVTTRSRGLAVRLVSETAPGGGSIPDPTPSTPETSDDASGIESAMAALVTAGGTTDLIINRTLYKDGFFNTLCLPFSLNASELAASPLAGCQLYSLSDASYDGDNKLDLTIAEESTIEAGMPYLIKWSNGSDITSMTFTGVTVTASTGSTVTKGTGNSQVRFVGTIGRSTLPAGEENYLFLGSGDNLYYPASNDDTSMKGFRAYFIVGENSTNAPHQVPARLVIAPKMPTAVDNVQGDNVQSTKVIENGQLFIIKNGVKYNAQGKVVK